MPNSVVTGANTRTAFIPETTYGTNPATGAAELHVDEYEINYDPSRSYITNLKDSSISFPKDGNEVSSMSFTSKLFKSTAAINLLLNRFFVKGTTTGAGDPYTHPYTMDYETKPGSFTFEAVVSGEASSNRAIQAKGCTPNSITLSAALGEHPTISADCLVREVTRATGPGTAYTGSTDSNIFCAGDMFSTNDGESVSALLLTTGASGYFVRPVSFELTLSAGLDEGSHSLVSNLRPRVQRGGPLEASGTLEFILETGETWSAINVVDLIKSNTGFRFDWEYRTGTPAASGYRQFKISLGNGSDKVYFDPEGATFTPDGPGKVMVSAPFQLTDVESSLTATINNALNSAAAGV
jgi:hypothetical protein